MADPTPFAAAQGTKTSGTGTACTGSLKLSRGPAAVQEYAYTSTLAQGPRTQTAQHSWHSVFP
jgi:hypothetical protein